MKANSRHYILLLIGAITMIVTGFGYWYVYSATVSQAEKQSKLSQEIKNNEQSNKQEVKLLELSASTAERRSLLHTYFVSDEKILDFIKSIENISKDSSAEVVISSIANEEVVSEKSGTISPVKLHLEIKGTWLGVNKALALVENLPYSVGISTISLRSFISETPSTDKKTVLKKTMWTLSLDMSVLSIK